eukprot:5202519-Alexandrium_andersonii.AAC.1
MAADLGRASSHGGRAPLGSTTAAWLASYGCEDRWLSAQQAAGWLATWKRERAHARRAAKAALGEAPAAWTAPEHLRLG